MDEFTKIVVRLAGRYVPKIASFLETRWSDNTSALKEWHTLVALVGKNLDELSEHDSRIHGFGQWGRTGSIFRFMAESDLRDEGFRKAFVEGRHDPSTREGNPQMLSSMATCLEFVLDRTYAILTNQPGHERTTPMGRLLEPLGTTLERGEVRTLGQIQSMLLEPLHLVQRELARLS